MKVLLLDIMGTVVHEPFHEDMPAFFGMSLETLIAEKHPTRWLEFERGEIENDTFLRDFFADGREYDRSGFERCVRDAYRFLPGMERLLADLHSAGVPMHALSNYPTWSEWIEEKLTLERFLDWRFVSWKTGVRKPDPAAYLGPIRELGVEPNHLAFVDDREVNVVAARAAGIDGIRFTDAEQLRRDLVARGLV